MLAVHVAGGHKSHIVCLETQAANVVTASRSIDGENIIDYYGYSSNDKMRYSLVEQTTHFLNVQSIVEIKANHQLLGQIGHGAIEERQLFILCHVDVKAKVPKVAVVVAKVNKCGY